MNVFLPQLVVVECIDPERESYIQMQRLAPMLKKCMTSDDLTKTFLIVILQAVHIQTLYPLTLVISIVCHNASRTSLSFEPMIKSLLSSGHLCLLCTTRCRSQLKRLPNKNTLKAIWNISHDVKTTNHTLTVKHFHVHKPEGIQRDETFKRRFQVERTQTLFYCKNPLTKQTLCYDLCS